MNTEPLISVIIPAYNSEKTIERTLNSIFDQTCTDYEVVVINDGSVDKTLQIVDKFRQYPNLKVISIKNSGVCTARNQGIDACAGKYVVFLDSDDWVDHDFLSHFFERLTTERGHAVDLIVGDLKDERIRRLTLNGFFSGKDVTRLLGEMELSDNIGYLHNKCYKKKVLQGKNIRFLKEISMSEDLMFNLKFISEADSFLSINSSSYHYEDMPGSLSKKKVSYELLRTRRVIMKFLYEDILGKYNNEEASPLVRGIAKRSLTLDMQIVTSMFHSDFSMENIINEINRVKNGLPSRDVEALMNRNEKIKYFIIRLNSRMAYNLFYLLYKFKVF